MKTEKIKVNNNNQEGKEIVSFFDPLAFPFSSSSAPSPSPSLAGPPPYPSIFLPFLLFDPFTLPIFSVTYIRRRRKSLDFFQKKKISQ